jgi:hypothetical protein
VVVFSFGGYRYFGAWCFLCLLHEAIGQNDEISGIPKAKKSNGIVT